MNKILSEIYKFDEYEIIDSGPIETDVILKTKCSDDTKVYEGTITGFSRMFIFNTDNGINICLQYPHNDIIKTLNNAIPFNSIDIKYMLHFESLFGPAILSFSTESVPIITGDYVNNHNTNFFNKPTNITTIMFYTRNDLSLQINGMFVARENIKNMIVFTNGQKLNKDPMETCRELALAMQSPSWFDSIKDVSVKDIVNNRKNKILQNAEDKMMQTKRDKISDSIKETSVGTQSENTIDTLSLTVKVGSKNPINDLDNMIGLEKVKKSIKKLYYKQQFNNSLHINANDDTSLHMCFLGNPGTGKTTIARIITGILYDMKLIKYNRCVEINGLDLIGNYVGQTGIITKKIIDASRGGVLFIDEAYAINTSSNPFGPEAISVLLKEMEDNRGDVVVILAGYADPMNKFLDMNSGFRSRINRYFEFEDYTPDELFSILGIELKNRGYTIDPTNLPSILANFYKASKEENFSNGRYVRNYVEKLEDKHITYIINELKGNSDNVSFDFISDKFIRKIKVSI